MIKDAFIGRHPSHFHLNPIIKAFIISESFLWSAWSLITPIFAVFVTDYIQDGDVQAAATGFSIYLVTRVVFEMISGRFLNNTTDSTKLKVSILGMSILSIAYGGFIISTTVPAVYFFFSIAGLALGIATPAKNALFSLHLNKDKATTEWGVADGITFISMALATALGGFIANSYGFQTLFLIAAVLNLLGLIPYILQLRKKDLSL
jgi:MFS family permease